VNIQMMEETTDMTETGNPYSSINQSLLMQKTPSIFFVVLMLTEYILTILMASKLALD